MSLLTRAWERLKAFNPSRASYTQFELDYLKRHGVDLHPHPQELLRHNISWVYGCANRNATTCAGVPLRVYSRVATDRFKTRRLTAKRLDHLNTKADVTQEAVELLDGYPLVDLLNKANSYLTGIQLRELTSTYLELLGNAYWYLERANIGGQSVPVGLWPLMSQWVRPVPDDKQVVAGYWYGKKESDRQYFDAADIIHFKFPSPHDYILGMSPLQAILYAVNREESRQQYAQALWDNDARPPLVLKIQGQLAEEQRQRIRSDWNKMHKGVRNAARIAVMPSSVEVQEIGITPRDATMLEEANLTVEEIAFAYGVPLTMIKLAEAAKAGAEAGNAEYMATTIQPRLRRMEQKLNEELCPLFDERVFVAFDDPVPQNRVQTLAEHEVYLNTKVLTRNEVRLQLGMEPIDGGDEFPEPPPMLAPPANGPLPEPEPEPEAEPEKRFKHWAGCPCAECTKALSEMTPEEQRLSRQLVNWFNARRDEILERLEA